MSLKEMIFVRQILSAALTRARGTASPSAPSAVLCSARTTRNHRLGTDPR